ncbi:MAG: DUF1573 domain-containing protein [bacterium]
MRAEYLKTGLMLLIFSTVICAGKGSRGPVLWIKEPDYNFGKVDQGANVFHAFSFKNTGGKKLEIKEVKPGCGCTAGEVNKRFLGPGDTASVLITFNTTGYNGEVSKTVKIFSNDAKEPQKTIRITGIVQVDLIATPSRLYLNLEYDNNPRELEIKNNSNRKIKLINVISEKLEIVVENPVKPEEPVFLDPGANYKFRIAAAPTVISNENQIKGAVRIFSDSRINPILTINVNVTLSRKKE